MSNFWTLAKSRIFRIYLIYSDISILARFWQLFQRMNKKIAIITLTLAAPLIADAQQEWSLDRCVSYAIEHATEVGRERIEQKQAQTEYRNSLLDFLPSVSAQVGGQYNWGRNIDPETNTYNTITTFNNGYQINASLPVVDWGHTWNAFRKARLTKNTAATALQKAQDNKAIDVMQKFVDAVYAIKSIELTEQKLTDSKALLEKTRKLYELGEKSRPDVAQMESQVAEDDYNLLHQKNLARTALLSLKTAMNYPSADSLNPDCSIADIAAQLPSSLTIDSMSLNNKPEIIMADAEAEKARLEWKIRRADALPQLSLYAGVSTTYYINLSQRQDRMPFGSQLRNNLGEYVSLTLSIPIFSPSTWSSVKRAKSDYILAKLDAQDARRKLNDAALQAVIDYEGYQKEVRQMGKKVAADSLAYRLSYRKYEEGMLSTFDIHEAAQTYLESSIKLLQLNMLLAIREKLVRYYINNEPLWTSN